jgi:hypothetical protein
MHLDIASDGVSQIMAQFGHVVKADEISTPANHFTGVQFGKREKKIRLEEERRRVETN